MTIKISEYCLTAYDLFKSSVYRWHSRLNKDAERAISRVFYQAVRDTNPDKTGFSTLPGVKTTGDGLTDDHFMSPQTVAKYIMDSPKILKNYEEFKKIFLACRKTVVVTKEQNNILAQLTKKQPVLTKDKFYHLGYKLYYGHEKLPEINQVLPVPELYTKWEKKYIINDFRPTVVWTKPIATLDI